MLSSPIEEIKNKLDIVEVIGSYIKVQKAGANYRALCPFHAEKSPSFFISPARQIWHCFGSCSEGGDIFKFVMKIEGVEFADALRLLAQKAGVELQKQDPKIRSQRQRLYEICALAGQFFSKQMESGKKGQEAKKYLLDRGISQESLQEWQIGYAPDLVQALSDFLVGRGYKRSEVDQAGLAVNDRDRFRSRIMFPIFDLNSKIIGFGGRIFGDNKDTAKYVNTPNTLLYDKSRVLYGLNKAKLAIRKEDKCILVEGYTDVIMSVQSGVENVAAASGTALTEYQLGILRRYSNNLLTAFDMDAAGNSATRRSIDLARIQGFDVKVTIMPSGKDPADVIASDPKKWRELTEKGQSIMDFYFTTAFAKFDGNSPEGKREISKELLPTIKKIPNQIEQSHWVQELGKRLEAKEEDVRLEMRKCVLEKEQYKGPQAVEASPDKGKQRKQLIEERIVAVVMKSPQQLEQIKDFDCFSAKIKEVLDYIKTNPDIHSESAKFLDKLKEKFPQLADDLNHLCFRAEIEEHDIEPELEMEICLAELKTLELKAKLDEISFNIKKAEEAKDDNKVKDLMSSFNKLANELNNNHAS